MIKRTLYFGNPAYLSTQNEQLIIRLPEVVNNKEIPEVFQKEAVERIPIEDIGILVLDHTRITLTSGLLEKLILNNVALIQCGQNHLPIAAALHFDINDTFSEKIHYQLRASEPLKKQLWKQTIEAKILNQAAVLQILGHDATALLHHAKNVSSGDPDNREGRAAAKYWEILLKPYGVTRGQNEGPPNQFFNYGYALLRAVIARNLVASGCLPVVGIHHRNKYNAFCLADDIMEPFRPIVDLYIFRYLQTLPSLPENLEKTHKGHLLQIPVLDTLIDGKNSPLLVGAQRTTASVMKCFMGETRKILYPILYAEITKTNT